LRPLNISWQEQTRRIRKSQSNRQVAGRNGRRTRVAWSIVLVRLVGSAARSARSDTSASASTSAIHRQRVNRPLPRRTAHSLSIRDTQTRGAGLLRAMGLTIDR
jgi:hypothetical protein